MLSGMHKLKAFKGKFLDVRRSRSEENEENYNLRNSLYVILTKCNWGEKIKENEVDVACGTYGIEGNAFGYW
jgi:hypothetical protein